MNRFQQTGEALGSSVLLTIIVQDEAAAKPLFHSLWAMIQAFEQRFSRFLPTSELTAFNAAAGQSSPITPAFRDLLQVAKDYGTRTAGLYNPFTLPALQRAGYVGSWPSPSDHLAALDYSARQRLATAADIRISDGSAKIPADTALDFGGIGKGYLLDQLGAYLDTKHVKHYWLSLGGDILCHGYDIEAKAWKIGIGGAEDPDVTVGSISNTTGQALGIATSGITKRRGRDWHHIIDPRTGQSAETDILTATLAAPSATAADVAAKCLVIAGSSAAKARIKSENITACLLQIRHNETIKLQTYGAVSS